MKPITQTDGIGIECSFDPGVAERELSKFIDLNIEGIGKMRFMLICCVIPINPTNINEENPWVIPQGSDLSSVIRPYGLLVKFEPCVFKSASGLNTDPYSDGAFEGFEILIVCLYTGPTERFSIQICVFVWGRSCGINTTTKRKMSLSRIMAIFISRSLTETKIKSFHFWKL
jgi:hypothetical protein